MARRLRFPFAQSAAVALRSSTTGGSHAVKIIILADFRIPSSHIAADADAGRRRMRYASHLIRCRRAARIVGKFNLYVD